MRTFDENNIIEPGSFWMLAGGARVFIDVVRHDYDFAVVIEASVYHPTSIERFKIIAELDELEVNFQIRRYTHLDVETQSYIVDRFDEHPANPDWFRLLVAQRSNEPSPGHMSFLAELKIKGSFLAELKIENLI